MTRVLGPERVPAGFTITTEACVAYMRADAARRPRGSPSRSTRRWRGSRTRAGKRLGDPDDPLLVSVRSGARDSMPGMMDTVLNLGLNDESVAGLAARTGNERFAWDSYRRLVQMFGNVVCGVPGERFEDDDRARAKRERGVTLDTELDVGRAARARPARFQALYDFPAATRASSSSGDPRRVRLVDGRARGRLPPHQPHPGRLGHRGQRPADGVRQPRRRGRAPAWRSRATRSPARPSRAATSCSTRRARTSSPACARRATSPSCATGCPRSTPQLLDILRTLERHYGDMQDTEFTVEEGRLYMLQTRNAKRPAQAAVRFAVDAVDEGLLTRAEAIATIDAGRLDALLHPTFDPDAALRRARARRRRLAGRRQGRDRVHRRGGRGGRRRRPDVILVRPFTEADDVAGFHAARGILTSEGGKASHAALVARGMGRPAVTGAAALDVDLHAGEVRIGERVLHAGDLHRHRRDAPAPSRPTTSRSWRRRVDARFADRARMVRRACARSACAPTPTRPPTRAARATFGAEGIGLCRTEHMFMAADRQPKMRR